MVADVAALTALSGQLLFFVVLACAGMKRKRTVEGRKPNRRRNRCSSLNTARTLIIICFMHAAFTFALIVIIICFMHAAFAIARTLIIIDFMHAAIALIVIIIYFMHAA